MAAAMAETQGPKTYQQAVNIDGEHTDILCTWFSDRIMVVVTQYNKFGTLINIKKDKNASKSLTPTDQTHVQFTFSTKVVMGKDEPIWHVYGRQIAIAVSDEKDQSNRPVLLAIALKRHSPEILHCIMEQIKEIKTQNAECKK